MLVRTSSVGVTHAAKMETTVEDRIRGAYFGALVADALCLGSHYEYDATKIKNAYGGIIDRYLAPGERMGGETHGVGWGQRNYHPGTVAGDQTDYGEYNVLMLEYLAKANPGPVSVEGIIPHWQHRLADGWKQWICTQTKQTYQQIMQHVPTSQLGGNSNAMALRYAAIFAYTDDEEAVVDAARKTMFTHREQTALLGNEFFARVVHRIIRKNVTPREAIDTVTKDMASPWIKNKVDQAIKKVEEATDPNQSLSTEEFVDDLALTSMARLWEVGKREPIKVGKASPTEGTLPGAIYFILKYQGDLMTASKMNAMVGGDNASRSIAVGMVLGAYHGVKAIPVAFKEDLNQWDHSENLLKTLPMLVEADSKNDEL